ncbi:MAG: TIGR03960 family B12-binding radical SAM protein [Acidobacteria bacterium]|nr:TIGR03960 family B12-binding radical SAM protein [Acidobacteriota bacterium]MBI3655349.1 TIGR03960 family B12-binding radical SAM protein [Acidobacteriota bacterium]
MHLGPRNYLDRQALDRILSRVQKPIRYVGGEWSSLVKDANSIDVSIALGFPDTYEIGMSHLGLKILYGLLNEKNGVAAERVFAPWPDFERELRSGGLPLYTLETKSPVIEFDFFGFSIQYELCYANILTMLDLSGIPLRARDRDLRYPLVLGGGPCTVNPEPIADFFDLFLLGEAEEALPELLDRYVAIKHQLPDRGMSSKQTLLRALAEVEGFYAPALYDTAVDEKTGLIYVVDTGIHSPSQQAKPPFPVRRRVVADLSKFPFPNNPQVPFGEIVHDRISIEVARGCTEGCRFCQAGTIYRPVRERKASDIVSTVKESLRTTGYDEVSLASLSFGDYSCATPLLKELMQALEPKRAALSLPSLRAYALTDEITDELKKVRRTGLTIAPEGGTQRMRDVINKNITEDDVLRSASSAFANGWNIIKLYFMIGLPSETDEDVVGVAELTQKVVEVGRRICREQGKRSPIKINLSASSFVPKPQTPFQWSRLDSADELYRKQSLIRSSLRTNQIHFKYHDVESSQLEGVFSRGDRALANVIENAWRKGCRFDGWTECFNYSAWQTAFTEEGVNFKIYLQEFPIDSHLPWDHLDSLVKKSFQLKERNKALAARVSPPCEKPYLPRVLKEWGLQGTTAQAGMNHIGDRSTFESKGPLVCYACGLECDLEEIRAERLDNFKAFRTNQPTPIVSTAPLTSAVSKNGASAATTYTYRTSYVKLEEAKYASSLDLSRAMARAFLRAGIRLKYSQGFHPAPAISFGPALSVGVESLDEFLDFSAYERLTKEDFLDRVNPNLPAGLRFTDFVEIPSKTNSLFKIINGAVYSTPLNAEPILEVIASYRRESKNGMLSDSDIHRHLVEVFTQREKVIVVREREGTRKELDMMPFIQGIDFILDARPPRLSMTLSVKNGVSVRPGEVLAAIYGIDASHFQIRRDRLLFYSNNTVLSPLRASHV